jgi:hypothetical protein
MNTFEEIDKAILENLASFQKPGAMTVRPGYKIAEGWITKTPSIVVTVASKRSDIASGDRIPRRVGGFPTDVRQASGAERLRRADAAAHAKMVALARPEYLPPEFPMERDVATGRLLGATPSPTAAAPALAMPRIDYSPPPGSSLGPVTARMSFTCVASPDAGWPKLRDFLREVGQQLTVGLYDFTSAHVLDEVRKSIGSGGRRLSLVLDHPPKNPTADQTDEQTQATLAVALGDRESFAWAAEAHDPMVSSAVFPNAYHIKVAVADHELFWLSSGNWNNSNQPDIDPWTDKQSADEIAKKSDRDWHVILRHSGLAQTFEAFLSHDLEVARQVQAQAPAALLLEREVPAPEPRIEAVSAPHEYFHPLEIKDEMVTIQPLFTPDVGAGNYAENILKLIDSAAERLYIQTQYVHPPRQGIDAGFQALIEAVKGKMDRRLDVKIILSQYEATGGYLEKLQEAGWDMSALRIQDGVHNKGFIVDSKTVALGSQNWSGDGVLRNRDATLIIYHKGAAQYFERIFLHDWNNLAHQKLQTR